MKSNLAKSLACALFVVAVAHPVLAEVVNYGTGIHHLVKTCTFSDHETQEYVGASSCPPAVTLPPNCSCAWTPYDFPVGNPYPYLRVQTLVPTDGNGNPTGHNVNVIVDASQAIQCGTTVILPPNDPSTCGIPYTTQQVDPKTLNPVILEIVQGLDFSKYIDGQVTFTYFQTQAQTTTQTTK